MDPATDWICGVNRHAMSFDGSDDQAENNGAIYWEDIDEALSAWIRITNTSQSGKVIFGYINPSFVGSYGRGFYYTSGTLYGCSESANDHDPLTATVNDTEWHHVYLKCAAAGELWLDGQLVDSGDLNGYYNNAQTNYWLSIGAGTYNGSNAANCAVDITDACIWRSHFPASASIRTFADRDPMLSSRLTFWTGGGAAGTDIDCTLGSVSVAGYAA